MLRGTIEDGKLLLSDGTTLPNGTHVRVEVDSPRPKRVKTRTLDSIAYLSRHAVSTGIKDLSDEHDHYIYGTPKRSRVEKKSPEKKDTPAKTRRSSADTRLRTTKR